VRIEIVFRDHLIFFTLARCIGANSCLQGDLARNGDAILLRATTASRVSRSLLFQCDKDRLSGPSPKSDLHQTSQHTPPLTTIREATPIPQEFAAKPCSTLRIKANRREIGLILMGKGNKAYTLPPSIAARGPLNISALAGPPVTHYG
jgi:hypothetical protein